MEDAVFPTPSQMLLPPAPELTPALPMDLEQRGWTKNQGSCLLRSAVE
jgi:hypothetical protein